MTQAAQTAETKHTPEEGWLLVKRDLYWRPNSQGYTGIRDEAGRYSHAEANACVGDGLSGVSMIHEADAPEFRQAAFSDLVIAHLIKQRDAARADLAKAEGRQS